jgi:hypothetical protein
VEERSFRAIAFGVVILASSGCSGRYIGAPPVRLCGQVLYSGAMGLGLVDLPTTGLIQPPVLIRLVKGCDVGASMTVTPPTLFRAEGVVKAKDGGLVAVYLVPTVTPATGTYTARLSVAQGDREVANIVLSVGAASGPT